MKIFGLNITRAHTKAWTPNARTFDPAAWVRGDDIEESDGAKLLSPYSQSAWVYIAVSVLAETVAQIPFRIARLPGSTERELTGGNGGNGGIRRKRQRQRKILSENIIERGAVVDLFDHPHPTMDRALFWEMLMTWRCLRGEFFILPLDAADQPVEVKGVGCRVSREGRIRRLITLSPDQFWHIVQGYELQGWRFTGAPLLSPISSQVLLPEEVIHSRSPNPFLYWRGMSPLQVAHLPAAADYAAEQFMKGLMINNADCGLLITTTRQLSPEQVEEAKAALRDRKRRAGTADRPLFLYGGMKIEKPQVSSADLQFLENRKLNRQEIAAIFKVPESLMGFTEQKNALSGGSSIEQDRLIFFENAISSHCRRLEAAVAPIIKTFGADLYGFFDLDSLPIMQQARRNRLDAAAKAFAMGVPFNEINSVLDLGFKNLPWGDTGYLPANLQSMGKASPDLTEGNRGNGEEREDRPRERERNPFRRLSEFFASVTSSDKSAVPIRTNGPLSRSVPSKGREEEGTASQLSPLPPVQSGASPLPLLPSVKSGASSLSSLPSVKSGTGRLRKFFFEQRNRVLARLAKLPRLAAPKSDEAGLAAPESDEAGLAAPKSDEAGLAAPKSDEAGLAAPKSDEAGLAAPKSDEAGLAAPKSDEAGLAAPKSDEGGSLDTLWDAAAEDAELLARVQSVECPVSSEAASDINQTTWQLLRGSLERGLARGETGGALAKRVKVIFQHALECRC